MKKLFKTVTMAMVCIAMTMFVSCKKGDKEPSIPGGGIHKYVDLGLPSGTLWATCNVGATSPEDYGDYFEWGETLPKSDYDWSTYQWCNGSENTLTKYCTKSDCGYNGFEDNKTVLEPVDDVARVNWGDDWRMPTSAEWQELYDNTTSTWTTQNDVCGYCFTSNVEGYTDVSLFLPAAGLYYGTSLFYVGSFGEYWSSSLDFLDPNYAFCMEFALNYMEPRSYDERCCGFSVRPVR